MGLKLHSVPARQGLVWVRLGLLEFWRHPLGYASLFVVYMLAQFASLIPYIGGLLLLMGIPLLSLAYMMATLGSQREQEPRISVFLAPWHAQVGDRRRQLLLLCVAYTVLTLLGMLICGLIDGGSFERLMQAAGGTGAEPNPEELTKLLSQPEAFAASLLRLIVIGVLGVPFWHAPALIVWGGQRVPQALVSSTLAVWNARGAFLVYGLGWLGAGGLAVTLTGVLAAVTGISGMPSLLMLTLPMALTLTTAYYVSLFYTFRDSFGLPDSDD
jgi:hypothetical protein